MFPTPMPPSSSGTVSTNLLRAYSACTKHLIQFSTLLTTSLGDQCFSTLVERRAESRVSPTCRLEVSVYSKTQSIRSHKSLTGFLVIQILMEKFNGLGVILENRYYGESYPYNSSTTDELRFLTTEQS